jgi:aspartate kinase
MFALHAERVRRKEDGMPKLTIVTDSQVCEFTIHALPDQPGVAADVFGRLGGAGISVLMMAASGAALGRTDVAITISTADYPMAAKILAEAEKELDALSVSQKLGVAAISVVSAGMKRVPGVAGRIFRALSAQGINVDMISAADDAVMCVVSAGLLDGALHALRTEFAAELMT